MLQSKKRRVKIPIILTEGEKTYSGLYEYHIPTNTWKKRRDDVGCGSSPDKELKSRSSHSMLFHQVSQMSAVEHMPRDREDMSLNPAGCLAFSSLLHPISSASIIKSLTEVQHY